MQPGRKLPDLYRQLAASLNARLLHQHYVFLQRHRPVRRRTSELARRCHRHRGRRRHRESIVFSDPTASFPEIDFALFQGSFTSGPTSSPTIIPGFYGPPSWNCMAGLCTNRQLQPLRQPDHHRSQLSTLHRDPGTLHARTTRHRRPRCRWSPSAPPRLNSCAGASANSRTAARNRHSVVY